MKPVKVTRLGLTDEKVSASATLTEDRSRGRRKKGKENLLTKLKSEKRHERRIERIWKKPNGQQSSATYAIQVGSHVTATPQKGWRIYFAIKLLSEPWYL